MRVTQVAVILSKFGHIHVHMSVSKFAHKHWKSYRLDGQNLPYQGGGQSSGHT